MQARAEEIRRQRKAARIVRRWPSSSIVAAGFELRHLQARDREAFFRSIDDDVRYWQGYDEAAVEGYARVFPVLERRRVGSLIARPLVVVCTDLVVGCYILTPSRMQGADVDLGWWLAPGARGHGLGRASLAAVVDHVHRDLGLTVARMGTSVDNVRATRQIEAVGATPVEEGEHELPNGCVVIGRWYHHTADA